MKVRVCFSILRRERAMLEIVTDLWICTVGMFYGQDGLPSFSILFIPPQTGTAWAQMKLSENIAWSSVPPPPPNSLQTNHLSSLFLLCNMTVDPWAAHPFFEGKGHLLGQNQLHPLGYHGVHPAIDGLGADVGDDGWEWGGALSGQGDQHADAFTVVGQFNEVVP